MSQKEYRAALVALYGPNDKGEPKKGAVRKLATRLGISYSLSSKIACGEREAPEYVARHLRLVLGIHALTNQ